MKTKLLIGLIIIVILLTGCSSPHVIVDEERIEVEIADTPEEREKGLMHREELCDDCGMLFIFREEKERSFWMKDTKLPLDIIFIGEDKRINEIHHAEPCKKDPCRTYEGKAKYVLETNKGRFQENITGRDVKIRIQE
ncbi:MAG: DUF192 domain-containing protein [Nanobdellota archaeon]